ncbi:kunitz-type protease inhibitor 1-like [Epinephelus lanceolatus]
MPPSSSSLLLLLLLLLPLPLVRPIGAAEDAACSGSFRVVQENFVLDAEDAVNEGAALLSTAHVHSEEVCTSACCEEPSCNLALLEPRGTGAAAENRTCVLFNCVHRNRFVCRFVNQKGYLSYIREAVYRKHLQGPQGAGEQPPPIAIAGRDVIVQLGEPVLLNGIQSLALGNAHITDYDWTVKSGNGSIGTELQKTDLPDQVQVSFRQPGSYVFQLTVTDSNDQSHAANVTVLVLSQELSSLYCLAPVKVGPCRAAFPRWHYDADAGKCEKFVFGGCKANDNNFLSEEDCLSACRGVTVTSERRVSPPAAEECGKACRRDQLICDNGCCLDRSLECDNVTHCSDGLDERHCSKLNKTLHELLDIDVNLRKARCAEPPRTGPCRASFSRWYYDPLDRKCSRFTYGGCDGNENNFEEEEKCKETCKGVTERNVFFKGLFYRYETEEESDSGNIALAVCLSVAILALLAVLAYCFLKSRKERAHRPIPTSSAHVPLSGQETSVYNSTTKPV